MAIIPCSIPSRDRILINSVIRESQEHSGPIPDYLIHSGWARLNKLSYNLLFRIWARHLINWLQFMISSLYTTFEFIYLCFFYIFCFIKLNYFQMLPVLSCEGLSKWVTFNVHVVISPWGVATVIDGQIVTITDAPEFVRFICFNLGVVSHLIASRRFLIRPPTDRGRHKTLLFLVQRLGWPSQKHEL